MKKYMIYAAAAALLSSGCAKMSTTELYVADQTLKTTGNVTLCLSVEDLSTKVSADDNGHFLFGAADSILVACSEGGYVKFRLAGTGDTKRAFFEGEIPEGKTIGSHVVYPCSAAKSFSGSDLTLTLPEAVPYDTDYPCPMVGAIGQKDFNVKMYQLCSYAKITIDAFPAGVSAVKFNDAGGKTLSGEFSFNLGNLGTAGIAAKEGQGAVRFAMTASPSEATFSIPCAVGDYNDIKFTLLDEDDKEIGSQSVSSFPLSFARGSLSRVETSSEIKIKSKQVVVDGKDSYKLIETSAGVYEATVDVAAISTFALNIDSQLFGFASYSGAGGVGSCKNDKSALPYYNFTSNHTKFYNVSKAVGELSPLEGGGNEFWVNLDVPGKVKVVYDSNYGANGSYYIELVQDADPSVIFDEQFDLCTCGGDVVWVIQGSLYGSDPSSYDGVSAATPKKANWNASGSKNVMFDYPTKVNSSLNVASSTYMANRGLEGWTFACCDERPGALQINQGNYDAYCITPELSAISGSQDITVAMDISRYSSTSLPSIFVEIIGGGQFASAHVDQTIGEAFQSMLPDWQTRLNHDYTSLDGTTFTIGTDYCACVPTSGNTVIYKPVSSYKFNIKGATASTQIKIHAPYDTSSAKSPRCVLYGIKITK